ncbi:MAG TPA: sodium:solute symporter [Cytophagales bacterium]|jgi:SSS family solute:Na+ symporter|nr:sodium:solute symporter [Cytophagales bacterium]
MKTLDWIVLIGTLSFIVIYGVWKTRGSKNIEGYLKGDNTMKWWTIGLSIMATQASAITFLSAPGQAYDDGMRFVQFYFGLPIAMVILSITVVPIYHKLKVYTAYEYLENRFDLKTRVLTAILFLTQRGLAAGFTIFAPSLILSTLLGWNIYYTNLVIGLMVIIYTVSGGTKAVAQTQKYQMGVILLGMVAAGILVVKLMPENVGFVDALEIAGKTGRLNVVDLEFDPTSKYNIWSGLIGGGFLALSYFGTDQSQVARYLTGSSIGQSRLGLLFNGIIKIPMQFFILLIGALVYVFYIFQPAPLFFNNVIEERTIQSEVGAEYLDKKERYDNINTEKRQYAIGYLEALDEGNDLEAKKKVQALQQADKKSKAVKKEALSVIEKADPNADTNDTNFIFLTFVINYLPAGLVGLIIAVIFSASMSSTSSELNALASTTIVDIYKRLYKKNASERHYLNASKVFTMFWGVYAILFAMYANRLGTLIEAVNKLGSLVYGTILGVFLVAFYMKNIKARETFIAAIISESIILLCFFFTDIPFLWYNVIGSLIVLIVAYLLKILRPDSNITSNN